MSGHIYAYMWAMNKFFVYKLFNFWHLSNKKKFKTSKNWQCLDCKIVLPRWAQIQKKCAKGEIMLDIWGNYWYSIYWYIYLLTFFIFSPMCFAHHYFLSVYRPIQKVYRLKSNIIFAHFKEYYCIKLHKTITVNRNILRKYHSIWL